MDRRSSEARSEPGAAELVADIVPTQNTYQVEFIGRQEWQNSNKKVIITIFINIFFVRVYHNKYIAITLSMPS